MGRNETHEERRARQRENERRYRERNAERLREMKAEKDRRYRERHGDEIAARQRARYETNREEIKARRKAAYDADPEPRRESVRRYAAERREEMREKSRANYLRFRNRFQTYHANRRARMSGAEGTHTDAEWQALLIEHGHRCAYCGTGGQMTKDHRVPLSRGGTNWISNILPACKLCNNRKHARSEDEFRAQLLKEVSLGKKI